MTPSAVGKRMGAGAAGALAVYGSVLRPRIRWLGTSDEERAATYPGDDLIPRGRRYGAMATTIAARPERVWPWLVQMGCDRAGFYSFDLLDNGGRPSADRIHTRWQNLREGDRIVSVPDASRWFDDGHTRLVVTGNARGKPHALIAVATGCSGTRRTG